MNGTAGLRMRGDGSIAVLTESSLGDRRGGPESLLRETILTAIDHTRSQPTSSMRHI
jgi:hypothetical protein